MNCGSAFRFHFPTCVAATSPMIRKTVNASRSVMLNTTGTRISVEMLATLARADVVGITTHESEPTAFANATGNIRRIKSHDGKQDYMGPPTTLLNQGCGKAGVCGDIASPTSRGARQSPVLELRILA